MTRLRLVVTAGPTREWIDPVRYLSNASSGRTGYAVAAEAARRGHHVTLVSGPVSLPAPPGVSVERVEGAEQMRRAVGRRFESCDALIMSAAVADYAPASRARRKIRRGRKTLRLRLHPTSDILGGLGRRKGRRVLVGFALETHNPVAAARAKLREKNLDLIVANRPDTLGGDRIRAALVFRDGRAVRLARTTKAAFAARLIREVERACRCSKEFSSAPSRG